MDQKNENQNFVEMLVAAKSGMMNRRQLLQRGLILGLSSTAIMTILAACGGDDDDDDSSGSTDEPTATPIPVGVATSTATEEGSEEPEPTEEMADRSESDNKTFVMVFTGGVPDVDPQSAYDNQASSMFMATYEMLIRLKGESTFEYEPMLATEWESNDDLTEFTFKIREGVLFHDGSTCDAQAVVDSLTRFHQMGRGPVDVIARFVTDPATQMAATDEVTIVFTMNKPEPLFLPAIASEYGPLIVSPTSMAEHATAEDEWAHEWYAQNMVGTGPYVASEIESQERFVMDRFDDYNGPEHFFDQIVARVVSEDVTRRQLIESGEADGVAVLPPEDVVQLKSDPNVQVIEYETTQNEWIRLNYVRLNTEARQGLCWAFPYDEVIDEVLLGFAKKQGPIADTVVGYDPDIPLYDTDLNKAKELLESAGVMGEELSFIMTTSSSEDQTIAQLFQANLAEIGVDLKLEIVDRSALIDMAYGDSPPEERPHMMASGWWPDYNDSYNQLFPNFHPDSAGSAGSNSMFYGNEEVGDLLDKARDSETEQELVDLTGQILQIMIWDDPAAVFYDQVTRTTILNKDIRGFVPNGIYIASYNFHEMWREAEA